MSSHYDCIHGKAYWQYCKECQDEETEYERMQEWSAFTDQLDWEHQMHWRTCKNCKERQSCKDCPDYKADKTGFTITCNRCGSKFIQVYDYSPYRKEIRCLTCENSEITGCP